MYTDELSTRKDIDDPAKNDPETIDAENSVKEFLNILYGENQGEGYLVLWTKQDKRSYFFPQGNIDDASKKAIQLSQDMDVYYGIGLQSEKTVDGGRGGADTVVSIPGLWLDIDIKGANHVSEDLPPDRASIKRMLDMSCLKPTVVVKTGGGYHIYWLFKEPMITDNEIDREKAKDLSSTFQRVFQNLASQNGWRIDNTSDVSRLLRLPGTYNHKNKIRKITWKKMQSHYHKDQWSTNYKL